MTPASNMLATPSTLAFDSQGLDALRAKAKTNPAESAAAAAKQFESLFLGMVMKSMRAATPQDGLFESEQTKLYTSMLDQQLAQQLSKRGIGLAEVMTRQLSPNFSDASKPVNPFSDAASASALTVPVLVPAPAIAAPANRGVSASPAASPSQPASEFVNRVMPHAVEAAKTLGVQPQFIVGQAALESGWGKYEIRTADGQPSHNLFGIKAGGNWKGAAVEKLTTEYVNGVAIKTVDKFRVYSSYTESFRDYANLLKDNARYAGVIGQGDARGFAQGLQRGGYATDPAYAEKLVSVIGAARDIVIGGAAAGGGTGAAPDVSFANTLAADVRRATPAISNRAGGIMAASYAPQATAAEGWVRAAYSAGGAGGGAQTTLGDARAVSAAREPVPSLAPIQTSPTLSPMAATNTPVTARAAVAVNPAASAPSRQPGDFVNRVWSHAVDTARELGLQPQFLVGQAALESGWGRYEIRTAEGQPTHNLFAIKAGPEWKGPTVEKTAVNVVNGSASRVTEKFRVYSSYAEAFRDYASVLRDNPRYAGALGRADAGSFARGLQRGGYATDPAYADKLVNVINSPPLRQAAGVMPIQLAASGGSQVVVQR